MNEQAAPARPTSAPPRGRTTRATIALIVVAALGGGALGAGGARLVPTLAGHPAAAPAASAEAAIVAVIRRANAEQQQALATGDPAAMQDTATAAHYREMVRINADLAAAGTTGVELLSMTVDAVSVSGDTAQATTTETWRVTYADGRTDQRTAENVYALVRQDGAWKIASDDQPGAASSGTTPPAPPLPQGGATTVRSVSRNWAGYVATGGRFTAVTGTWTVPEVTAAAAGADATWVGIGGERSTDLIQAGTEAIASGRGAVRYGAWVEALPQPTHPVPLTVSPGDTVTVALTETAPGTWSISIRDDTTAQSYATTVRYASSHSSAEWIEEAPSSGRAVVPLDDFGSVRFTAAAATRDGQRLSAAAAGARALTMTDGAGLALATPSPLGGDGSSFAVTRTAAPATSRSPGGRPRRG